MTGFFNSNKSRMTSRGRTRSYQSQNKRLLREMTNQNINNDKVINLLNTDEYVSKKTLEANILGFLGYSLKYGNVMIVLDTDDILGEYILSNHNSITNNYFDNIRVDKLGIMYLPKLKKFAYLALNDNFELYILFKSDDINTLPNIESIDLENLPSSAVIVEEANTRISSIYKYVHDLSIGNPLLQYKVNEVFKR